MKDATPGNIGLLAHGAYIPRRRLQRDAVYKTNAWFSGGLKGLAKGERAAANWDEDPVTMAVEAARDALTGIERTKVGTISLASTTLPFADRLNAGIVKEALVLSDTTAAFDLTGSQRAGTSGLIEALAAAADGKARLLCASELRKARPGGEAELVQGDAAAALLVGRGDVIARHLGSHSVTIDFVDHYRTRTNDFDYTWETRWIRDEGYSGMIGSALRGALEAIALAPEQVDHLVVPITAKGVADGLAKRMGIRAEAVVDSLAATVGDSGAAHPLLLLGAALEKAAPGETIVVVGFGQGVDVIAFEATEALASAAKRRGVAGSLARGIADQNYSRFLFHRGLIELDRGMRAEFDQKQPGTTLWRNRRAVLGLVGGRCSVTGTVQFPKSDISVNPNERISHSQEDYPLADRIARVVTFTADSLTYTPDPPNYYGMVDFEGGGRMLAEFADIDPSDEIEVGCEMQMMFRIKAVDEMRDFTRYFWKAVPVQASSDKEA